MVVLPEELTAFREDLSRAYLSMPVLQALTRRVVAWQLRMDCLACGHLVYVRSCEDGPRCDGCGARLATPARRSSLLSWAFPVLVVLLDHAPQDGWRHKGCAS